MSKLSAERRARRWTNAEEIARWMPVYNEQYPDDQSVLNAISKRAFDDEPRCKSCNEILPKEFGRSVRCLSCRRLNWLTAETFFRNVQHIRAWWGTVWFMANTGVILTANQVKELFGIALSTAQNILANIAFWVARHQTSDENAEDLSSSFLRAIYSRRSIKTPADADPVQEQDEIEKLHQVATLSDLAADFDASLPNDHPSLDQLALDEANAGQPHVPPLFEDQPETTTHADVGSTAPLNNNLDSSDQEVIFQNLTEAPVTLEQLLASTQLPLPRLLNGITILELDGRINIFPGNRFALANGPNEQVNLAALPEKLASIVASFIEFIKIFSHGIARKNVQLYLSMFWYYQSRATLGPNWLIQQLCGAHRLPRDELVAYVSPLMLKVTAIG